jgi:hypothetical protein
MKAYNETDYSCIIPDLNNNNINNNNNNNNTKSTIRRKKKLLSQGGQKWFKGSPRKNSNRGNAAASAAIPGHLLQSSVLGAASGVQDKIDTTPALPPLLVQFTWGDCERRLSVHDPLELISIVSGRI